MAKVALRHLLKRHLSEALPTTLAIEDQDALDTNLPNSLVRGTKEPTAIDQGRWLELYQKMPTTYIKYTASHEGNVTLEDIFLSDEPVTSERIKKLFTGNTSSQETWTRDASRAEMVLPSSDNFSTHRLQIGLPEIKLTFTPFPSDRMVSGHIKSAAFSLVSSSHVENVRKPSPSLTAFGSRLKPKYPEPLLAEIERTQVLLCPSRELFPLNRFSWASAQNCVLQDFARPHDQALVDKLIIPGSSMRGVLMSVIRSVCAIVARDIFSTIDTDTFLDGYDRHQQNEDIFDNKAFEKIPPSFGNTFSHSGRRLLFTSFCTTATRGTISSDCKVDPHSFGLGQVRTRSFESSAEMVKAGILRYMLVPGTYSGVGRFLMDEDLLLTQIFKSKTPALVFGNVLNDISAPIEVVYFDRSAISHLSQTPGRSNGARLLQMSSDKDAYDAMIDHGEGAGCISSKSLFEHFARPPLLQIVAAREMTWLMLTARATSNLESGVNMSCDAILDDIDPLARLLH